MTMPLKDPRERDIAFPGDDRLPDDLDALGRALELATAREVRRRQRFNRFAQGAAVVAMALPFAIAVMSVDVGPALNASGGHTDLVRSNLTADTLDLGPPTWAFAADRTAVVPSLTPNYAVSQPAASEDKP